MMSCKEINLLKKSNGLSRLHADGGLSLLGLVEPRDHHQGEDDNKLPAVNDLSNSNTKQGNTRQHKKNKGVIK